MRTRRSFARILIKRKSVLRIPALAFAVSILCVAQNESIRIQVRLVNVAVTVRDASGKLVSDLTKDDFEILDDTVSQPIAFFDRSSDLPLVLGLVADMSGSQAKFVHEHEKDLKRFLKSVLRPHDQAFLLCFGNRLRVAHDFSNSAGEIMEGLQNFKKSGSSLPQIGPEERRLLGTAFYDALYYSVDKLAKVDGRRKALIVLSDGEDNSSARHMMDAIEIAQRENAVVYALRYTDVRNGYWNGRNKYGRSVLERIARETGGADFDGHAADLKETFQRIGEELRFSYELAYYSPTPVGDGTFHKISVRLKKPDLKLRSKTGYYAKD